MGWLSDIGKGVGAVGNFLFGENQTQAHSIYTPEQEAAMRAILGQVGSTQGSLMSIAGQNPYEAMQPADQFFNSQYMTPISQGLFRPNSARGPANSNRLYQQKASETFMNQRIPFNEAERKLQWTGIGQQQRATDLLSKMQSAGFRPAYQNQVQRDPGLLDIVSGVGGAAASIGKLFA